MNVLVTGGAGFIGSHVAELCLLQGHTVTALDNLTTGKRQNVPPGVTLIEGDIRELDTVKRVFAETRPDWVFHQAAQAALRPSVDDPWYDLSVNLLGSLNLIHTAVTQGVGKFVYASSGGACYGPFAPIPTSEEADVRPNSPYGITKHTVEHYLDFYQRNFGLSWVGLRYANVYGPRQDSEGEAGVVAIFSRCVLENRRPTIFGDGTQRRDYVYVTDVARANLLAAESDYNGVVNIATGIETSVLEVLAAIQEAAGTNIEPIFGEERVGDLPRCALTNDLARQKLGWEPTVKFRDGIIRTVEWTRQTYL
ncbi:MAG: NAD-dependent epimerase/dehydratase family protein [Candidatus Zipacnadales bacterium]